MAPKVWSYLESRYGPAEGAGWDRAPLPPYLWVRGAREPEEAAELRAGRPVAVSSPGGSTEAPGPGGQVARLDPSAAIPAASLMRPSLSEPPPYRVEARGPFVDLQPERRVSWESMYLRPALVLRAPWGWRKVMATWEVPAGRSPGSIPRPRSPPRA